MEITDSVATILQHKGRASVQAVTPDTFVFDAIKLMADRNIGCVLVMEGETLHGILSERDYTRKVVLQGRSSKTTTVREIMTRDVICVTPKHGVEETLRIVTESRVRHLPVKDAEGRVIGLISIGDMVKWVINAQRSALSQLEAYVAGGYPG